ncbi:mutS protein homolog 4-like [Petromyzon marinus]|uniref:mutS protein homolog 4-like n=1 Tax=Petromyzon marinus TaxID=7757 RepID=UPI003F6F8FB3
MRMSTKGPKYSFGLLLDSPPRRTKTRAKLHSTTTSSASSSLLSSTPAARHSRMQESGWADRSGNADTATTTSGGGRARGGGGGGGGCGDAPTMVMPGFSSWAPRVPLPASRFRAAPGSSRRQRQRHAPGSSSRATTSTATSFSTTDDADAGDDDEEEEVEARSVVVALAEGRGIARGEVGLASIDLRCPELVLCQFPDSQPYVKAITKLQVLRPLEVVMPHTACNPNASKMFTLLRDYFPEAHVTTVLRKYFNEERGMDAVRRLCVPHMATVLMDVQGKYYCLASLAALLQYVEFIQGVVLAPASVRVSFCGSERTAMIDGTTAANLELLRNSHDPRSSHSLFGVLNYTRTRGGARRLRANIHEPLVDEETLRGRLDCVDELMQEDNFYRVQAAISQFLDVDHLLSMLIQIPKTETLRTAESKINYAIHLKHVLELVSPLQRALSPCKTPLLTAYQSSLLDCRFPAILAKLRTVLTDDLPFRKGNLLSARTRRCHVVRPGLNGFLDLARRILSEAVGDIEGTIKQLSEIHNLPMSMSYSAVRGFYIQTSAHSLQPEQRLPEVFIKVSKRGNLLSYTTMDLMRLNCRSQEAVEEIYLMSNVVLSKLFAEIREDIVCLYKLADAVSMVDMLLAFAHRTTLTKSVRPEFSDTLALKGARHPILERVLGWPLVPNDVFLSDASNFLIVTGPNNSGKSTLLRQVALCQVMAQIGCFVPADFACVRIADQIFTRIGVDDDIQPLSSTFTIEMREVNYIVRTATDRSLVIIDELGRGTGVHEALGICHSVCECLLQRKTFTIFATHHLELSHLSTLYPNVSNSHFLVESRNQQQQQQQQLPWAGRRDGKAAGADDSRTVPRVTCTYKLVQGHTPDTHYGLEMATLSSLPPSLLRDATGLLARIGGKSWMERQADSAPVLRRAAVHRLATRLGQAARHSRLDGASLATYLGSLRQRYLDELEHIADATANTH